VEGVDGLRAWLVTNEYQPMNGYNLNTPVEVETSPPVASEPPPEVDELDLLIDETIGELNKIVREPTQPGEQGIETIIKVETEPKPDDRANVMFYGYWNDVPSKYPNLRILNWTVESLVKLFGWKDDAFTTAHTYEGKWNVTYELSEKTTKQGNYYKNVVAVDKVE